MSTDNDKIGDAYAATLEAQRMDAVSAIAARDRQALAHAASIEREAARYAEHVRHTAVVEAINQRNLDINAEAAAAMLRIAVVLEAIAAGAKPKP